jgi:3-oxoadipate enol-lactonase
MAIRAEVTCRPGSGAGDAIDAPVKPSIRSPAVPCKYVPVDDVATFVHHRGPTTLPGHPPDTATGEVVLCVHDAGDNGNVFAQFLDALAGRHSPLAYDQPGHGRSGGLDSLGRVDAMAAHAKGLAEGLQLRRPVLVGDGLGAAVALQAALDDPAWPRALVLCGGAGARGQVAEGVIDQLRRVTAGKARREFDQSGYAPGTGRDVYQRAFVEWVKTDPRVTLGDREAQAAWDVTGRLGDVSCPVLVVVGEHEEAASRSAAEQLAAGLPHARVVQLDGAARRGVLEQPAALADHVARFVEEIGS